MRGNMIRMACGLAVAAMGAPTLAQAQQNDRERTGQQYRDQQARNQQSRDQDQARNQSARVLQQMEGMWMVQVQFDPQFMKKMHGSGHGYGSDQDAARDEQTRNQQERRAARDEAMRGGTVEGIARSRLILGDNVLEQRVFMMMPEAARAGGQNDDQVQGLAFFAFDPQQDTYTSVFMSDTEDMPIRYQQGNYDATNRRIVFNSGQADRTGRRLQEPAQRAHDRDGADREGRNPRQQNQNQNQNDDPAQVDNPNTRETQREGVTWDRHARGQRQHEVVVLEMIDSETFRVTMYDPQKFNEASLQQEGREEMGQQASARLPDGVLYRATYTKATGERAESAERWFERAISQAN